MRELRNPLDLLGASVSAEHGDCSIAADTLSHDVHELMAFHRKHSISIKPRVLPLIESPKETLVQPVRVMGPPGLKRPENKMEKVELPGLNPIGLVLIERLPAERKRLAFVPRLPRRDGGRVANWPVLAAFFEDSFLLPLASFKRTEQDGTCSVMQIGNEPRDNTVHGTGLDDRTPSLALVEAVRCIGLI